MIFDENGNICSSPEKIADVLQRQFCSVFSDPSKIDSSSTMFDTPEIIHPFTDDMLDFSISDVIEAINDIKLSAAAGPDDVPAQLVKNCKYGLAVPIYMIWSHSKAENIVYDFYKTSHIAPLHKKDSKAIAENYRPVSLTSHIIKIYERIVRKKDGCPSRNQWPLLWGSTWVSFRKKLPYSTLTPS